MKEIIKLIKNNYKIVIGLILGILVSSISVYAVEKVSMIDSEEVTYNNTESHGDYDNVQQTIDELYKKVGFTGEKWIDPTLNGADPVLSNGLIPVVISSKGEVYYANEYTRWYDYSQKRWANAVILVENAKDKYKAGEKIEEQDIESYFVWIPRYKYRIWNIGNYTSAISGDSLANIKEDANGKYAIRHAFGNARVIDVVFGDKEKVKVEGNTKKSGTSGDTSVSIGDYLIHPAFTLGTTELNGIWVGKFETGYKGASSTSTAQQNKQDSTKIIIKPNVYSWRDNTVKNFFMSAYNYHRDDYNSHMMKNTEWGAVAYLSHSSYGIGGEININNNNTYKTGYSSYNADQSTYPGTVSNGSDGKSKPWNTSTGYLASTTGNITGVYDMSGGAWEYVAGYKLSTGSYNKSGLTEEEITTTYKDYIDQYDQDSSTTTYNKRILGDATGEMGPFYNFKGGDDDDRNHNSWYADYSYFVFNFGPWFIRSCGYDYGVLAGQFSFYYSIGGAFSYAGFRLVLSIS